MNDRSEAVRSFFKSFDCFINVNDADDFFILALASETLVFGMSHQHLLLF
jgi:hypothetical protein